METIAINSLNASCECGQDWWPRLSNESESWQFNSSKLPIRFLSLDIAAACNTLFELIRGARISVKAYQVFIGSTELSLNPTAGRADYSVIQKFRPEKKADKIVVSRVSDHQSLNDQFGQVLVW